MLTQFQQMKNLGGMAGFLDKMPGMSGADVQKAVSDAKPEEKVKEMEALIHSMTPFERKNPDKINPAVNAVLRQARVKTYNTSISC
ncbi:MAG: hypothetical protein U1E92_02990 [Moraxella osloensis]